MIQRLLMCVGCAAIAVGMVACASKPTGPKPVGQVVIPFEAGKFEVKTTAKVLNEVVVSLPPIQIPGHLWFIVYNDDRVLQQLSGIEPTPAGAYTVRFLALKATRRATRFLALPPNDREATPSQTYAIRLEIE